MIVMAAGFLIGAAWGGYVAKKRGGNWKDMAQYGAAYGIALALVALFLSIFLYRLG